MRNDPAAHSLSTLARAGTSLTACALSLGLAGSTPALPRPETPSPSSPSSLSESPSSPLILISWDGGADWAIDRLLAEGRLPHLAALTARGVRAEWAVSSFPSKTAAAHASVWTGCWPACHGVTANEVAPRVATEHSVLEYADGFASTALGAEPIWVSAAAAGRRVVALSATQDWPPDPWLDRLRAAGASSASLADRVYLGSEFAFHVASPGALAAADFAAPAAPWPRVPGGLSPTAREAVARVGDTTFYFLAFDDPADPVAGLDSVLIRAGDRDPQRADGSDLVKPRTAAADPAGWSRPFTVRRGDRTGTTYFRLFELAPDGSRLALYRRGARQIVGSDPVRLADLLAVKPAAFDQPFAVYDAGGLGTPIPRGGDGQAEERVLEAVAFDTRLAAAATRRVLTAWRPDLLIAYSPAADDAGHAWVGALDPALPGHDPAVAARLWPYYAGVFAILDGWLGDLVDAAEPTATLGLFSDHGMAGIRAEVSVGRILADSGLLALDADGGVDLAYTRAVPRPWKEGSTFAVAVNRLDFRGGIVPSEDVAATVDAAAAALLAARDPATGVALIERVLRPSELPGLGLGPDGGDLYLDPAAGYYPVARPTGALLLAPDHPWGDGEHGLWPERRAVHAIFYAAGPGLARGVTLPPLRLIDVVPTLAHATGLPTPAQATGRVIAEALAERE